MSEDRIMTMHPDPAKCLRHHAQARDPLFHFTKFVLIMTASQVNLG